MNPDTPIGQLPLVGPVYIKRLKKLEIKTAENMLLHIPSRYIDFRLISKISRAQLGETVTIKGEVVSIKNIYSKRGKKMQIAEIKDSTGQIEAIWFNQPFLINILQAGTKVSLAGKIDWFGRKKALISPEYEKVLIGRSSVHTGRLIPIYPETAGVSSKWLRGRINDAFSKTKQNIEEYLPNSTLQKLSLSGLVNALEVVHFPKNLEEAQKGRERLSFDELLFIQLKSIYRKLAWQKNRVAHKLGVNRKQITKLIGSLPFNLTSSQKRSIEEILSDLEKDIPMNRLLEGDVGSGKTVVAAITAFVSFLNEKQTVFMAPTQILAEQHFVTLKQIFDPFKLRVALITSAGIKSDPGRIDIFIGTHALIHRTIDFDNVAMVIIDEQHRFGVEQRTHLIKKSRNKTYAPHVLTMTATPIPRTIALTFYGDIDLSTLDELPAGRQPTKTWVVPPQKRESAYEWIDEQIKKDKIQAFIICPLIEESEKETMQQVRAATTEYENLRKIFPDLKIGLLHGKQSAKLKNKVLNDFKKRKSNILVSTPVVEVGIDVPNATIMIIEAAERFGLAQLHQLRGRIGRGKKKSYCLLFTENKTQKASARLSALQKTLSGFELAELDLKLRGPGEVFGTKQHGFAELKIASWQDKKLIKKARNIADEAIKNPKKFSKLLKKIKTHPITPN
jgi:ATP-dependent DNA helicase RecG